MYIMWTDGKNWLVCSIGRRSSVTSTCTAEQKIFLSRFPAYRDWYRCMAKLKFSSKDRSHDVRTEPTSHLLFQRHLLEDCTNFSPERKKPSSMRIYLRLSGSANSPEIRADVTSPLDVRVGGATAPTLGRFRIGSQQNQMIERKNRSWQFSALFVDFSIRNPSIIHQTRSRTWPAPLRPVPHRF